MWEWSFINVLLLFITASPLHQDLGSTDGPPRNWKGIGIAMVVILAVMSLVILSVPPFCFPSLHLVLLSLQGMDGLQRDLSELNPPDSDKATLQFAAWGPQGNQLAFVYHSDIYYRSSVSSRTLRLTVTEQQQHVINGLSDWTYEEEILGEYSAHWWSMDGARLAYLSINNSATPVMEIPHFLGGVYPSNVFFPYPKAGSSIPSVILLVVNLYGPTHTLEMNPPESFRGRDGYVSMVTWISSTRLAVRWLNRSQNQSVLCVCEATTGACSEKHKAALDIMQNRRQDVPLFSGDGSVFYTIVPAKQGARGEFHHIASAVPSVPPRFLTSGSFDVVSLCALDEQAINNFILFLCFFVSVDLDGVFQRHCVSCNLIDGCQYLKALFSPNQTHFTLYCLGPGIPRVTVHSTKDPSNLHLRLSLPQNYEANLHPLLIFVDGLPGSQSVTEEFNLGWPEVLSSMHSVALAWVDAGGGAGGGAGRGQQRVTPVDSRKLVSLRVKDYLGVVELLMQLPYIDDRRMALYGKAFGGYLALKMVAATDKLFQCTAAVAPITDFRLYSEFILQGFMSPQTASLLEEVNKLKDENFLILHGTADARVHFQHSAELLSRLVKVEANYSLQLYPDEGHELREPRSVQHFQRTVVNYLQSCLKHSALLYLEEEEEDEDEDD
uniref:Inactive dipeptidyl peptidase 10-like n=1 Tax=Gouania willdenowi TaxID=441366 RepID=A0A8C5GVA1_GOUWI